MNVRDLRAFLETQPPDREVYFADSEHGDRPANGAQESEYLGMGPKIVRIYEHE